MTPTKGNRFLEWRPQVEDQRVVFKSALLAAKRYEEKRNIYSKVEDPNLAGKLVLFQLRDTGASALEKYLEAYGCPDVVQIDDERQLIDTLASIPVLGVIFWYAGDSRKALGVVARLLANRDLPRRPLMLVCPGEEAVAKFKTETTHALFDSVEILPSSRLEFGSRLDDWFAHAAQTHNPLTALMSAREKIRTLKDEDAGKTTQAVEIMAGLQPLTAIASAKIWRDAEVATLHIGTKNWVEADKALAQVREAKPNELGLSLSLNLSLLYGRDGAKATSEFIKAQIGTSNLNSDQMLQLGRQIARWHTPQLLADFLNAWYLRSDLPRGFEFSYLIALYLRAMKNLSGSCHYLQYAIMNAPFRWELLVTMANNRLAAKDYRMAEHYWIVAKHHPFADPIVWNVGLIKAHYGQRRVRYADGLLAELLKRYPDDRRVLYLKRIFVDERLDQMKRSS